MVTPMALLLVACSDGVVYDYSVDVPSSDWAPTDTLVFPIHVSQKADHIRLIERNIPYCMGLAVRYERYYPCGLLQLHFRLDDGMEQSVDLMLGDLDDQPDGSTWGVMCTKEFEDVELFYSFPDSGLYQLKVWPDTLTQHIVSLTATLE